MKKLLPILLLFSFLLSACGNSPPSSLKQSPSSVEALPPSESTGQENEQQSIFYTDRSPYNAYSASTDKYIFAGVQGEIYRIDRQTDEIQPFISQETHDIKISRSMQCFATAGNALYFLSPNKDLDRNDPNTLDDFELRIMRANVDDATVEQVAVLKNALYNLYSFGDYLVARNYGDARGIPEIPEMEFSEAIRVYKVSDGSSPLEEVPFESLEKASIDYLEQYFYLNVDIRQLEERLGGGQSETPFSPIRANDAYYFLEFGSDEMKKIPLNEGGVEQITVSEEVGSMLNPPGERVQLVNYDTDWLYFTNYSVVFRVRKDGSEYQIVGLYNNNLNGYVDVVDGRVIYENQESALYIDNTLIA